MARKGLFEVKFRVEGETKRRSAYGKTKEEAKEKAIKQKALIEAGIKKEPKKILFRDWSVKYLEMYKRDIVSPAWYKHLHTILRLSVFPVIGHKAMADIKPMDLQALINGLGKSWSYEEQTIVLLKSIFEAAVDNDVIVKNPAKRLRMTGTAKKGVRRALTPLERDSFMKAAEILPKHGAFFSIMLFCGCRPQEVAALTWDDVDFINGNLNINKAIKADGVIGYPKTTAGNRSIPIPKFLLDKISMLPRESKFLFTTQNGNYYKTSSIHSLFVSFKRQMEICAGAETFRGKLLSSQFDELTPYFFRHTYCTDLQDAGVPITVASRLMGHANIQVTAKIYTHHSAQSMDNARELIEKHISTTKSTTPSTDIDGQN